MQQFHCWLNSGVHIPSKKNCWHYLCVCMSLPWTCHVTLAQVVLLTVGQSNFEVAAPAKTDGCSLQLNAASMPPRSGCGMS